MLKIVNSALFMSIFEVFFFIKDPEPEPELDLVPNPDLELRIMDPDPGGQLNYGLKPVVFCLRQLPILNIFISF